MKHMETMQTIPITDEMIERAARALRSAVDTDGERIVWSAKGWPQERAAKMLARAALEAALKGE